MYRIPWILQLKIFGEQIGLARHAHNYLQQNCWHQKKKYIGGEHNYYNSLLSVQNH